MHDGSIKRMPPLPRNGFAGWLADSKAFLVRSSDSPVQFVSVDVATAAQTPVATIAVSDPAGVVSLGGTAFAPDGDHYLFNYFRVLSELYIIDGLK